MIRRPPRSSIIAYTTLFRYHRDVAGTLVGHGQVRHAITIEVAHRNEPGTVPGGEDPLWLEGSIAVSQQQPDVVGPDVRHNHVQRSIAIEVAYRNRISNVAGVKVPRRLEGSVTVTQKDRDVVGIVVG